jgi:hypothetical protein
VNQSLETLRALTSERLAINVKLKPLNTHMATLRAELSAKQAAVKGADAAVNVAATECGLIEGRVLIGEASEADAEQARMARKSAETARAAAQKQLAGVGTLTAEINGLGAAGLSLGERLAALDGIEAKARERYLRDVVDEIASNYAEAARALAPKFAAVLAAQQMLARANLEPNLLTGSTEMLLIPAFNTPSARSPSGVLVDFESARRQQPAAFDTIRERLLSDGVAVPGLV